MTRHCTSFAYTYTIGLVGGGTTKTITETGDIRVGDCVSLEQGATANVRRVSSAFCEPAPTKWP
jgi:hypothetical protein